MPSQLSNILCHSRAGVSQPYRRQPTIQPIENFDMSKKIDIGMLFETLEECLEGKKLRIGRRFYEV